MAPIEKRLGVALGHLMDTIPYREKKELEPFIEKMPPEGQEWWLEWAKGAIERRRKQQNLTFRLQQKLKDFSPDAISHILDSFSEEGLTRWLHDIEEPLYPLAIRPAQKGRSEYRPPKEIFLDTFREAQWVHKEVLPAISGLKGAGSMAQCLLPFVQELMPFEEIGILNGTLFIPERGGYVPSPNHVQVPFEYENITSGLALNDYHDTSSCYLFHFAPNDDVHPPHSALTLITSQGEEGESMQQLRLRMYDMVHRPVSHQDCAIIYGDISSLEGNDSGHTSPFVLKHHPDKPIFFRELR